MIYIMILVALMGFGLGTIYKIGQQKSLGLSFARHNSV